MAKREDNRNPAEIDYHRQRIADLYLKQWRQVDIATELGIDQSTVSRDLAVIRAEWRKDANQKFDALKARELARIDKLEWEYWDQYEASKQEFTRSQSENIVHKVREGDIERLVPTGGLKVKQTKETRIGDPRFLAGVQWCIEQRCKILGIEAPKKTDVTSGGKSLEVIIKHNDGSSSTDYH